MFTCLLVHDFFENRTLGFRPVRPSVRPSVTRDLRNRSMDHFEILGDARGQKYKNRHTAAFLKKIPRFLENRSFVAKKRVFCTLQKNGSKDLSKTLTKCRGNCPL